MIARCAATLVGGFNFTDVEIVQDCIYGADRMILGNEVANAWREKKKIVLIVVFLLYLCHRMSDICFLFFALQIYKISHTKTIAIPLIIKRIAIFFSAVMAV